MEVVWYVVGGGLNSLSAFWVAVRHGVLFAVDTHPDMKTVVVAELERLLYRPRIAAKAQWVPLVSVFLPHVFINPQWLMCLVTYWLFHINVCCWWWRVCQVLWRLFSQHVTSESRRATTCVTTTCCLFHVLQGETSPEQTTHTQDHTHAHTLVWWPTCRWVSQLIPTGD